MGGSPPESAADPTHSNSDPDSLWSTTNAAEAVPGVLTPLEWTAFGKGAERGARRTFHAVGVLSQREKEVPGREEDRLFSVFYGRSALRVSFFCEVGNRLPGTSATAVAEQLMASVPAGLVNTPTRRYYPLVAVRFPAGVMRTPSLARQARTSTEGWWQTELAQIATSDRDDARTRFAAALARHEVNLEQQGRVTFLLFQPLFDQLTRLAASVGMHGPGLMAGYGEHEETRMVADLWVCSRGQMDVNTFLVRHGFHGPGEGAMSGVMWREDQSPLLNILEGYQQMPEEASPVHAEVARAKERQRLENELVAALPASRRALARLLLRLARRYLPMRGVCKVAYLMSLDVLRAAARRLGTCLADDGLLDAPEDIFFLTADELCLGRWDGAREWVGFRRARHHEYQRLELPNSWVGMPEPLPLSVGQIDAGDHQVLEGVAASPGVTEGSVRVITNPGDAEMVPGEILVAHVTDPAWASIMFLSSALVTDIGGLISHTAVVARELGIPCVVNTKVATKMLRTGDRCRVDGTTGRVEILERAGDPERKLV